MNEESDVPRSLEKTEIFEEQGCVVSILWWATFLLSFLSIHYWLSKLARKFDGRFSPYDHVQKKAKPWWQDIELLVAIVIAIVGVQLIYTRNPTAEFVGKVAAILVLVDLINYHARVLWFDDLRPPLSDSSPYVWTHRRILFHAAASFATIILIFSGFYRFAAAFANDSFWEILRHSFATAVTLSLRKHFELLDAIQVVISVFFLVVVIATIASTGYKRKELATPPWKRDLPSNSLERTGDSAEEASDADVADS